VTKVVGVPESVCVVPEEDESLKDKLPSPQAASIAVKTVAANNLARFFLVDIINFR